MPSYLRSSYDDPLTRQYSSIGRDVALYAPVLELISHDEPTWVIGVTGLVLDNTKLRPPRFRLLAKARYSLRASHIELMIIRSSRPLAKALSAHARK